MIFAAVVTKRDILRHGGETGTEASVRLRRGRLHDDQGIFRVRVTCSGDPIKIEHGTARLLQLMAHRAQQRRSQFWRVATVNSYCSFPRWLLLQMSKTDYSAPSM
jgi:hypothetical protein